jgi:two-component system, NarL family, sensor kinase
MAKGLTKLLNRAAERANTRLVEARSNESDTPSPSRQLLQLICEAQEGERRRVARELHDSVNQILSSVQFRLQVVEEKLASLDETSWREVLKAKALLEKAIQEVRRISHNLRPSELDDLGLEAAVRSLCRAFSERTGIIVNVLGEGVPKSLGGDTELTLYRITQEALTNIEKHAGASRVEITFARKGGSIKAIIRDNGRGIKGPHSKSGKGGMGLVHMRERASFLGGACTWQSAPGEGTAITVRLPLPARKNEKRKTEKNPAIAG